MIIILTFTMAFVLIYFSTTDSPSIDTPASSRSTSHENSNENTSSETSNPTSSEDNDTETSIPVESVKMKFTPDEISQIEALIKAAEESQVGGVAGGSVSEVSPSSTTSGKEYKTAVPSNVSIYFKDIESGYVYQLNADYKYFIASLIKAPYCMYLYTKAEAGSCDLNEIITIEYKDIQAGTGKLQSKKPSEFPLKLSVSELISYAIRWSDNTAMEALRKKYNHVEYLEYAKSLGLNYPEDVGFIVNGKITAKDAGVYINAIYDYIKTGEYCNELKEHMSNTINPMIRSKYPIIRKYGWAELSFHDMAIVDAPHPYLLTILSDKGLGTKSDHKLYKEISTLIESIQAKWYE